MASKDLDVILLREMFNVIRAAEIKNVKTQKHDDKYMVNIITNYITKKIEKEISNEN